MLQDEVRSIVDREGVVLRSEHPALSTAIDRLLRAGELVAVLPGAYAHVAQAQARTTRIAALAARRPDAVLLGRTAAQLTFWPRLGGDTVAYADPRKAAPRAGFRQVRWAVPPELVQHRSGLAVTVPALTALDLCEEEGGNGIDQALRTRTATLAGMRHALELTGGRRGDHDRRTLLLDSRDEPWSEAERVCHRLLRDSTLTARWRTNLPVVVEGRTYFLDVAFPSLRVVLEIDGRLHEDEPDQLESDRRRQNALVLDGWLVLRFTWRMLIEHPDAVREAVLEAVRQRSC